MANSKNPLVLTQDLLRSLVHYDPETGVFTSLVKKPFVEVGQVLGSKNGRGYLQFNVAGRSYTAHRLAWLYVHGEWPEDQVDHKNRVKSDNRISNLRSAGNHENGSNCSISKNNTSGIKGVMWYKRHQKWTASIRVNRKLLHLGYFTDIADAAKARLAAELKYFGEFSPNHQHLVGA